MHVSVIIVRIEAWRCNSAVGEITGEPTSILRGFILPSFPGSWDSSWRDFISCTRIAFQYEINKYFDNCIITCEIFQRESLKNLVYQITRHGKWYVCTCNSCMSTYLFYFLVQAEIYYICKQNGWILPTVYQGMYNAITRLFTITIGISVN